MYPTIPRFNSFKLNGNSDPLDLSFGLPLETHSPLADVNFLSSTRLTLFFFGRSAVISIRKQTPTDPSTQLRAIPLRRIDFCNELCSADTEPQQGLLVEVVVGVSWRKKTNNKFVPDRALAAGSNAATSLMSFVNSPMPACLLNPKSSGRATLGGYFIAIENSSPHPLRRGATSKRTNGNRWGEHLLYCIHFVHSFDYLCPSLFKGGTLG